MRFLLVISLISLSKCFKILIVIPKMGYSHMNFLGTIADTLVDAGHDVVTVQPVIFPDIRGNGTVKSRLIQVELAAEFVTRMNEHIKNVQPKIWIANAANPINILALIPGLEQMTRESVKELLEEEELMRQLRDEKFDVGIVELFDYAGLAVFEAIGLKNVVGAHSSSSVMEATALSIGMPLVPSYNPASLGITGDSTDLMTRATNLLFTLLSWHFQTRIAAVADQVMKEKLGPNVTPVWDTVSNMSWLLSNVEPLLDFRRPTLHNVIDLGGIGVHQPSPLGEDWSRILSLRSRTILISFGSVAPSIDMPDAMKKAIVDVIKSYSDITFIWKYERPEDSIVGGVENLVLSRWMPQGDLLADDRLTLFITHGGAGSLLESATCGKPLIVVPLFGDQTRNARLVEKFGFGRMVNKWQLSKSDVLHDAIADVLGDKKYLFSANRIRKLLSRRPFDPKEKLVKTIELAAEFGDLPELKITGRNLGLIVYYNLDLMLIFFAFGALAVGSIVSLALWSVRKYFSSQKTKTQ